jgi:hypothetical protein
MEAPANSVPRTLFSRVSLGSPLRCNRSSSTCTLSKGASHLQCCARPFLAPNFGENRRAAAPCSRSSPSRASPCSKRRRPHQSSARPRQSIRSFRALQHSDYQLSLPQRRNQFLPALQERPNLSQLWLRCRRQEASPLRNKQTRSHQYHCGVLPALHFSIACNKTSSLKLLTPIKPISGQILAIAVLGMLIRRCEMIFWEYYGK